jgi:AraC-like DNA-binding protein
MLPQKELPLARFAVFRTGDLDQAREEVAKIFCPHRLATVGGTGLDACHHTIDLGGFSLNYVQYGGDVLIEPGELGTFFLLQLPLSGSARIGCGGQEVDASVQQATLLSPSLGVSMRWSEACGKLLVQIPRTAMERALAAMLGRGLRGPIEFEPAVRLDRGAGRRIARMVHLLREDVEAGATFFPDSGAGLPARETLMMALLRAMPHSYSELLLAPVPGIAPRHVRQAEEYMRANVADPITIADIAEIVGVSVRSLQEGFRRFRDRTPLEALHIIRLDGARQALLRPDPADSVTTIALRWGFAHLSRFAGAYVERFHERPSETLRRVRTVSAQSG